MLVGENNVIIVKKNEYCKGKKWNWKKMHYSIGFKYLF